MDIIPKTEFEMESTSNFRANFHEQLVLLESNVKSIQPSVVDGNHRLPSMTSGKDEELIQPGILCLISK